MKDVKRLTRYLELVTKNIKESTGELKEFWLREFKKTNAKLGS